MESKGRILVITDWIYGWFGKSLAFSLYLYEEWRWYELIVDIFIYKDIVEFLFTNSLLLVRSIVPMEFKHFYSFNAKKEQYYLFVLIVILLRDSIYFEQLFYQ